MVKPLVPEAQETADLINDLILKSQELLKNHPLNLKRMSEGKDPANSIWPWSPGYRPQMPAFSETFPQVKKGAVISAVDLINGIGYYAGLRRIAVEGATGLYNTNYENKVAAALEALKTDDFVYLHIEASDEAGHEGDIDLKLLTIENLDKRAVGPIYEAVKDWDEPVAIAVLPDHPTPCELRTHTSDPIPFLIWYPGIEPDEVQTYDEISACDGSYGVLKEDEFIKEFMNQKEYPMKYYSTNKQAPMASLQEAVVKRACRRQRTFHANDYQASSPRFLRYDRYFVFSGDCLSCSRCFLWRRHPCRYPETNSV